MKVGCHRGGCLQLKMSNQTSDNNKRIAKNTLLLYFRMLCMMVVSLYTSRVILNALGVEDFGIYDVVGGVVTMFSVISGSLSAAISRFITYELGKGNQIKLNKIFSASVTIQLLLSLIIVVLIESVGVYFLNVKMAIPVDRMVAANWVLQFSIITFVINLISVPYNATIIAHEKMSAFAYISILEAICKLTIAYLILVSPIDRLIFYALLMCLVSLLVRFTYGSYCKRYFSECKFHFYWDKDLLKNMFSFAGWSFVGCSAQIMLTQGVNIITNLFFGVTVNAARGIATQLEGATRQLVNNFVLALNPQITKTYAAGEHDYTLKLVYQGAKYSFFLVLFVAIPFLLEINCILKIWLGVFPENAPTFVRWTIAIILADVLSLPIITANAASGKVKKYQLVVGGYNMMIFPIVYVCFAFGLPAYTAYIVNFVVFFTNLFVRIRLMRGILDITYKGYFTYVLIRIIPVFVLGIAVPSIICYYMDDNLFRLILVGVITVLELPLLIYIIGLKRNERKVIVEFVYNKLFKRNRNANITIDR